ncbi:MAG: hypothetical protein EOO38_24540 [Cytophagaceae bacterium]|nr:MAG: hypothetical protein EOO38_24540 [Cytophagaceae bacterium]
MNGSPWHELIARGYDWEYVNFQLRYCRAYSQLASSGAILYNGVSFDWLVVVDDDSAVWPANVRRFLSQFDPTKAYFIGWAFDDWPMVSGAGALISAAAMKKLVPHLNNCSLLVAREGYPQDKATGAQMLMAGVPATPEHRIYMTHIRHYEESERSTFPLIAHHLKGKDLLEVYMNYTAFYGRVENTVWPIKLHD